jgi:hypothetical protein
VLEIPPDGAGLIALAASGTLPHAPRFPPGWHPPAGPRVARLQELVTATRPTLRGPAGGLVYRLARPSCQTWNPADGLPFDLWPPCH